MTTSPVKSPELRTLWPVKFSPSVPQPTPLTASPSWVVMFWKCLGKGPSVPQFLSQQNSKNCHLHRLSYQFLFQINVRSCLPSRCCNCTACVSSLGRSDVFMVLDLCIRNTASLCNQSCSQFAASMHASHICWLVYSLFISVVLKLFYSILLKKWLLSLLLAIGE